MRGVRGRFMGGIAAAALALAMYAGTVQAAIVADPAVTVLYVKGDAEPNQIQVDCRSKIVTVNGEPAAEGRAACADLEKLQVFGFAGDDSITLTGFPKPTGGDGFSLFSSNQAVIEVYGGDGNDSLAGDAIFETLIGGAGDDVVSGRGSLAPFIFGGPGNDSILGGDFFGFTFGGKGADHLRSGAGFNFAFGQAGPDLVTGSYLPDVAGGGKGRDKLIGKGGDDLLAGQGGNDSVFGGAGRDLVVGNAGHDSLRGGPGRDREFQGGFPNRRLRAIFDPTGSEDSELAIVGFRLLRLLQGQR